MKTQHLHKTIIYTRNITNLRKQQKGEILQYKLRERNIRDQANNQIRNFKEKSIQNFRAAYMSAQLKYRKNLQLKNAEIKQLKSGNETLFVFKKTQLRAEFLARKRKSIIINLTQNYKRANSTLKFMSAKNNSLKIKYASMLKQRNDLIKSRNNVITYYNSKTKALQRNFNIEKAKNLTLQSIIRNKDQSLREKDKQLKLIQSHFTNIIGSYGKLFQNHKNQINKLKGTKTALIQKTNKMNLKIIQLKDKIKSANNKINAAGGIISRQAVIISTLNAKQNANLITIGALQSQLRGKINVSQCSQRGYTATAGIKANAHVFNGKKYIKEESIIGDKIYLNGKHYVKLINGKCMNQYTRSCPKPKIIFKRSTRSSTASDLIKHNILYRNYRCAVVKNARNKRFAYKRWIQQRNLIRAKTRKYPRYPPFNTRMCGGRRSISRSRNRCVGACARYRRSINSYRIKITKLNKEYNFFRNRLSSYRRLFRRYNGSQRKTPAYTYRMLYNRYLNLYRKTSTWPWWRRRRKARYRVLYKRYLSLLRRELAKGRRFSRLISIYSRNLSSRKRQIKTYNNLIRKYRRIYPRQLR
tara:strand:+ start:45 stop:1796 length:1752 start_codon:yes stop_codon:yes gene_type:complete